MKPLYVINSNQEKEPFSVHKIYNSARMAGAPKRIAREIANTIAKEAYPGISTSEIFQKVKKLLRQKNSKAALRFNLKEGMRRLGPSGFPFEKFVAEIFNHLGFKVKLNQFLPGFCINKYEIDFLAKKGNLLYVGECKYRNFQKERIRSKHALATYARFSDILKGPYLKKECGKFQIKAILVTNTKFTKNTTKYAQCMDIDLLGWKYPLKKGLESLIEGQGLYPVTILPSLRGYLKEVFVSEKLMLAKDVLEINPQKFAKKFKLDQKKLYRLMKEASILLE